MKDQEKIKRLAEVQEQIKNLGEEAVSLADELGVAVSFGDTVFARAYGAGSLRYTPATATKDAWGYDINESGPYYDDDERGWKSSGSDYC